MFETEYLISLPELIKAYDIPGLSLALISEKKIVTFECGVKNSISQDPVTSSTVFEAASLSKPLIAYAALELCENGLLEMDQPLSIYLPSPESEDPFLSAVTLRHVLSHTGGFPTANLKPGDPLKLEFYPGIQVQINKEIGWGLGWGIEITPKGSSSWHSGDNGTFQCLAFQNEQTGFIIMTNSANGMKIYRHIFDLLIGGEHPLFDWEQFDSRAEEKLDEEFLANWWKIYEL